MGRGVNKVLPIHSVLKPGNLIFYVFTWQSVHILGLYYHANMISIINLLYCLYANVTPESQIRDKTWVSLF